MSAAATLDVIDNYPGWERAPAYLEQQILQRRLRRIADLGGGAHPMLPESVIRVRRLQYCVLDISAAELAKAPPYCDKIQIDITAPPEEFRAKVPLGELDLVFSHMFLEHVQAPLQAHRNIHSMLRPGGIAIHFYPSPNNLPLAVNRLIPQGLSQRLVRIAQPHRDLAGIQGKFPAYYQMCGNPSRALHASFEQMGFEVIQHTGFIGHGYYTRFPVVREVELALRRILVSARIRLTSAMLLILEKRQR